VVKCKRCGDAGEVKELQIVDLFSSKFYDIVYDWWLCEKCFNELKNQLETFSLTFQGMNK